jgi:NADPH:quinone reductase-like Zn-dependent oxidoreductase
MLLGEIKGLGAYSEYTVADDAISFKLPAGVSAAEAATVPLACTTAWLALFSFEHQAECSDLGRKL